MDADTIDAPTPVKEANRLVLAFWSGTFWPESLAAFQDMGEDVAVEYEFRRNEEAIKSEIKRISELVLIRVAVKSAGAQGIDFDYALLKQPLTEQIKPHGHYSLGSIEVKDGAVTITSKGLVVFLTVAGIFCGGILDYKSAKENILEASRDLCAFLQSSDFSPFECEVAAQEPDADEILKLLLEYLDEKFERSCESNDESIIFDDYSDFYL